MTTSNFTGRNQSIETIKFYNSQCINTLLLEIEQAGCVLLYHAGDSNGSIFSCSKANHKPDQAQTILNKLFSVYKLSYWHGVSVKTDVEELRCQDDSHVIYQSK